MAVSGGHFYRFWMFEDGLELEKYQDVQVDGMIIKMAFVDARDTSYLCVAVKSSNSLVLYLYEYSLDTFFIQLAGTYTIGQGLLHIHLFGLDACPGFIFMLSVDLFDLG